MRQSLKISAKVVLGGSLLISAFIACKSRSDGTASTVKDAEVQATESTGASACDKSKAIWDKHIVTSRYGQLPALSAPGVADLAQMAIDTFVAKSFEKGTDKSGDTIQPGRRKLVHTWGAVALMSFVPAPNASGFTGVYEDGADCVIGRFSMATKPTKDNSVPALALKFFIDGVAPSVNLHVMFAVDGQSANPSQSAHNFFRESFSNILAPPQGTVAIALAELFRRGAEAFGAKDPAANTLSVEHLAKIHVNGKRADAVKAPFKLTFRPTAEVNSLMKDATVDDDFRTSLGKVPAGATLYDVYASEENNEGTLIGKLVLKSEVIASKFGDENLWFQHNKLRSDDVCAKEIYLPSVGRTTRELCTECCIDKGVAGNLDDKSNFDWVGGCKQACLNVTSKMGDISSPVINDSAAVGKGRQCVAATSTWAAVSRFEQCRGCCLDGARNGVYPNTQQGSCMAVCNAAYK